jgi:hypothetical protein
VFDRFVYGLHAATCLSQVQSEAQNFWVLVSRSVSFSDFEEARTKKKDRNTARS